MARYIAHVNVMLRPLVNDPQGLAIAGGLQSLGFAGVQTVRAGKRIDITLDAASESEASTAVREMCQKLLANPVIEDFEFEVAALATA
jgi:phosphoribosylformylglycinamidine synthase